MRNRHTQHVFQSGINKRSDIERTDDPNRLYTLQNARLFKRGETGYASRIEGFEQLTAANLPDVLDIKAFRDEFIIVFRRNYISVYDLDTGENLFSSFLGVDTVDRSDHGKLIIKDNSILISPYNRQLFYYEQEDPQWYLIHTTSTTPLFDLVFFSPAELGTGSIEVEFDINTGVSPAKGSIYVKDGITDGQTVTIDIEDRDGLPDINISFTTDDHGDAQSYALQISNELSSDSDFDDDYLVLPIQQIEDAWEVPIEARDNGSQYNATLTVDDGLTDTLDSEDITGGSDQEYIAGDTIITIDNTSVSVPVETGSTKENVAQDIYNNLSAEISDRFDLELDDATVTIERTEPSNFSSIIDVDSTDIPPEFRPSLDVSNFDPEFIPIQGSLREDEQYWYTVRYVFRDGHRTKTAFPKQSTTTNLIRQVELKINTVDDVDGRKAEIEIFRRRSDGNFFYIDRIRPDDNEEIVEYIDDGKANISVLSDENYIWSESHQAHEIVRDRYVRGNLEYSEKDYNSNSTVELKAIDEDGIPPNVSVSIFTRPRFEDGTESYFKEIDTQTTEEQSVVEIDHQEFTSERDIKEIGYYASFNEVERSDEQVIRFDSNEIYNSSIPSIATSGDEVEDKPEDPHVFVGFKHIQRSVIFDSGEGAYFITNRVFDEDWNTDEEIRSIPVEKEGPFTQSEMDAKDFDDVFPVYIEVNLFNGNNALIYKRKFKASIEEEKFGSVVYELAWANGLAEYARSRTLEFFVNEIRDDVGIASSILDRQQIEDSIIRITSVLDNTRNFSDYITIGEDDPLVDVIVSPHPNSRLYLVCERDTVLSDIDSSSITQYDVKDNWFNISDEEAVEYFQYTFNSIINNIKYVKDENPQEITQNVSGQNIIVYKYDDYVQQAIPEVQLDDGMAVFLESFRNESDNREVTHNPFNERVRRGFRDWVLNPANIYETIIEKQELQNFSSNQPNQLIWSEPFILGTEQSGTRTFNFESVIDISRDYGGIVDIRYIQNQLLVFCERGLAFVNVGEVLTEQPSGQTFVDSSRFLTGFQWILKNIPRIERNSIVEFEHQLFFSDGLDIWTYNQEGLQNVSLGYIDLASDATLYGAIDPLNKEYLLYDGENTWAYSFESGEFMGPYTYSIDAQTNTKDKLFTVTDSRLVQHNKGNTFNGQEYDTIIESVSNDLEEPSLRKLFRKFFIDVEGDGGVEFSYGKEYENFHDVNLSEMKVRNGYYNVGVSKNEINTPRIFWRFKTRAENFVLKMVSFVYLLRRRR